MKRLIFYQVFIVTTFFFLTGCKDKNDNEKTKTQLTINVKEFNNRNSGIKAYIFLDDSLYGKTDEKGIFVNNSVKSGNYTLTCSAINFRDTTLQIILIGGKKAQFDFNLLPDSTKGKVFGEFQDMTLFREKSIVKPEITTWDEHKVYDATTGATICYKSLPDNLPIPERSVSIEDSLITVSDGFGQYYFQIQCGTYVITGACDGYTSVSRVIKVLPDSKVYANFYLERK